MSAILSNTHQEDRFASDLFDIIEPLFVEHFEYAHGNTPTLIELKQHLVSTSIDKLVEHIKSINSRISELYSNTELTNTIHAYIRKLK